VRPPRDAGAVHAAAESVDRFVGAADDERIAYRAPAGLLGTTYAGANMGIYDREYYRDETRGSGFFSGAAPVCKAIIFLNVLLFVSEKLFRDAEPFLEGHFAAQSDLIFRNYEIYRLLTATFLHGDPLHVIMNMIVLWWAGREMEAMYGSGEFLAMYLTAAVFSTLCWAIADTFSPGGGQAIMIGASGAITALVVLYALYYPHRELYIFGILKVEIWMLLVIYIVYNVFSLLQSQHNGPGGIAFASHLGGAAYGYLYKSQDLRWTRLLSGRRRRPRLRVVSPEPRDKVSPLSTINQSWSAASTGGRTPSAVAPPEEHLDARLDEVLAKIAREGRGGLTDEENRVLQEASRRARDRRSDRL
jgi:membrane associated rhomboid family serine protease